MMYYLRYDDKTLKDEKNLTSFVLLTVRFFRVKVVLRVMINFVIFRFAPEVIFTAHDANLLITVWEISYGQVGVFQKHGVFYYFLGIYFCD
jgi:hypothetical protein